MATETQQNTLERVGSYPVVASTLDQVKTIYERCKDANNLLKYSLETAETGAKLLSDKASPVVHKLPLATVNSMALTQLDKLEEKYPIVTKPTEEVLDETKKLYESTLKPSVDKVQAVGQMATEKYTGAKEYAAEKYNDAKVYGMTKVVDLTEYSTEKVIQIRDAGAEKVNTFLQTEQGKAVVAKIDQAIDLAESYVDKYLPESESDGKDSEEKPRTRLYNRVLKEMKNLQMRSQETLQNLHFTVNLIEYARTNLDSAKEKLTDTVKAAQEKGQYYWDEIRKDPQETDEESSKNLEQKAIRMAQHLCKNLREGLYAINESNIPSNLMDKLHEARQFSSDLMWSLMKATNVEELPEFTLATAKDQMFRIQDALINLGDLIASYLPNSGSDEEVEMSEISEKPAENEGQTTSENQNENEPEERPAEQNGEHHEPEHNNDDQ